MVLIFVTFVFCQMSRAYSVSSVSISENATNSRALMHEPFIMYDVSIFLHDIQNTQRKSIKSEKLDAHFQRNVSLPFYYEAYANTSNNACEIHRITLVPTEVKHLCGRDFGIIGIFIMFTETANVKDIINLPVIENMDYKYETALSNLLNEKQKPYLSSVIISLGSKFENCSCSPVDSKTTEYVNKSLGNLEKVNTSGIDLGLEYRQRFLDCCSQKSITLFKYVKLTVLRIDVSSLMKSYSMFSKNLTLSINKNREYVQKHVSPNCKRYIRLVNRHWEQNEQTKYKHDTVYEYMIKRYLTENEVNDEVFIIRPRRFGSREEEKSLTETISPEENDPKESNPKNDEDSGSGVNLWYLLFNFPVGLILLAILLLWLQRRHYKKQLLTQTEIHQFYNGNKTNGYAEVELTEETETYYLDSTSMKFPQSSEISLKDIELQGVIGRGEFGVVHKGKLENSVEVAIKIPKPGCTKEQFKSALSELKIFCYIGSHPNIVSFKGAYTKEIQVGKLFIVSEYCGKGSLEKHLRSLQPTEHPIMQTNGSYCLAYDLNKMYRFAHEIAAGMEYVAGKRIVHGDLATRNILLTEDFTCKISDFGLSRRLYERSVYKKTSSEPLPWMWMAPESLKNMEFTTKSDVWSYGVTLWEIFNLGRRPYPGKHLTENFILELDSGLRMERPHLASEAIYNQMMNCWCHFKDDRPTFTALKEYFASLVDHTYQNSTTSLV